MARSEGDDNKCELLLTILLNTKESAKINPIELKQKVILLASETWQMSLSSFSPLRGELRIMLPLC